MKKTITLIAMLFIASTRIWAQATPNAGMENWSSVPTSFCGNYDSLHSWDNANNQSASVCSFGCLKSTTKHSGSFAVELICKNILSITAPGVITTGTLPTSASGKITGGIAYTLRPDSISGWYEYTPASTDKGFCALFLFGAAANNADTVAVASFVTPNSTVNKYTYFHAAFVYRNADPVVNSVWLLSSSEGSGTTAAVGSTIYVDDLNVIMSTVGVNEPITPGMSSPVYPNPASTELTVNNPFNSKSTFRLFDVTGRMVSEMQVNEGTNTLDVNTLTNGMYFYTIIDENSAAVKTGKLVIQK